MTTQSDDTRTPLVSDEEINRWNGSDRDIAECVRSIYEPHVAKLEAEIAAMKLACQKWEWSAAESAAVVLDCEGYIEKLIAEIKRLKPLPGTPTQGGGE